MKFENVFEVILIYFLIENLEFIFLVCLIICFNYIMNGFNFYFIRIIYLLEGIFCRVIVFEEMGLIIMIFYICVCVYSNINNCVVNKVV